MQEGALSGNTEHGITKIVLHHDLSAIFYDYCHETFTFLRWKFLHVHMFVVFLGRNFICPS